MESPEQLRQQLESLDNLKSVVKTMKALSAASIRQYETAVRSLTEYYRTVELGLQAVLKESRPAFETPWRRRAAIVFGSDHGLCGRFNEAIVEFALRRMRSEETGLLLAVGARVTGVLEDNGKKIEDVFATAGSASGISTVVRNMLLKIDRWRFQEQVDAIDLYYNRYLPSGTYEPLRLALLPVDLRRFYTQRPPWPSRKLPVFSMSREALLSALLKQYFFVILFRACAESEAAEHATRLRAMQQAGMNIDEHFNELTARYRRVRQAAITRELLDVVAGFHAVTESQC